jgi:tetratricopeptide (TPR) repeat protein
MIHLLMQQVKTLSSSWHYRDLEHALERTYDNAFALPNQKERISRNVGTLLSYMNRPIKALEHLRRSIEEDGDDTNTQLRMALCHAETGQFDQAVSCIDVALASDPDFQKATLLRQSLEAARKGTAGSKKNP